MKIFHSIYIRFKIFCLFLQRTKILVTFRDEFSMQFIIGKLLRRTERRLSISGKMHEAGFCVGSSLDILRRLLDAVFETIRICKIHNNSLEHCNGKCSGCDYINPLEFCESYNCVQLYCKYWNSIQVYFHNSYGCTIEVM